MFEELMNPPADETPAQGTERSGSPGDSEQQFLPGFLPPAPAHPIEQSEPEVSSALEDDQELPSEAASADTSNLSPSAEAADLADWKSALRDDFEKWLGGIEEIPELESDGAVELPDLYSFYEQLAIANVETRKSNRRTAEAFSQWAETLARFENGLAPLRESTAELAAAQAPDNELPRAYCLVLVELLDRMYRLAKAFQSSPAKKAWWAGSDTGWRQVWESQRQGFAILVSHFEELLKKEGVTRIDVMDQPFDPTVMTAVAVEPDPQRPAQTVLEEIAAGYRRRGELLRPAQVKVSARR
jgi:GrpE